MHINMVRIRYIYLTANVFDALEHAVLGAGEKVEVCGLLGGYLNDSKTGVVTVVHPLSNLSLHKDSFAIDVEQFCRERDAIENADLMPLALYHSHRHGLTRPSFRDRELPRITELPLLILAWDKDKLQFGCYGDIDGNMLPILVFSDYDLQASC